MVFLGWENQYVQTKNIFDKCLWYQLEESTCDTQLVLTHFFFGTLPIASFNFLYFFSSALQGVLGEWDLRSHSISIFGEEMLNSTP